LEWSVYDEMGGVEGALGRRADQAYSALGEAERQSLPVVLNALVTLGGEGSAAGELAGVGEWRELGKDWCGSGCRWMNLRKGRRCGGLWMPWLQRGS
jgi:hypothetical protein